MAERLRVKANQPKFAWIAEPMNFAPRLSVSLRPAETCGSGDPSERHHRGINARVRVGDVAPAH